jgi:cytochrome c oxidase subunit 2
MLFASGCATGNPQDTFSPAGPVADEQAALFKFVFWIAVVVFVLVEGAVIYITLRYRRKSDEEMPAQTHGNTKLELTWTFIPALIIVAIAIPTVRSIWNISDPKLEGPTMTVEAIGHQWWFEFRYPAEEIITANELRVPVGTNIQLKLGSQDVIHSFWTPRLAGKVDMVPTRDNQMWFKADEPGEYYGQCAEFCGIIHAMMRFRVIAVPEDEYLAWVDGMRRAPDAPAAGSTEAQGATLFTANCSTCHTTNGYALGSYEREIAAQDSRWNGWLASGDDAAIVSAPNLTNFGQRQTFAAGIRDTNKANLIEWITDPSQIKQGTRMQAHAVVYDTPDHKANLTPDEVSAIADYLLSLVPGTSAATPTPVPGGDPVAAGMALFQANACSGCHSTGTNTIVGPGLAGIGDRAATTAPGLNADAYITQSIREPQAFIVEGFSAPSPMPAFGSLSDTDISNLIAYLKTLN